MKFYLRVLFLGQCLNLFVSAYIPLICSANGGICRIDDINLFANKFMDNISNYVHNWYMVYCKYICSLVQYFFGTWIKYDVKTKPVSWYQQIQQSMLNPFLCWIGLIEEKNESVEELVCNSSVPFLVIMVSFGFYVLTSYLRHKSKVVSSSTKFDMSAYSQDFEDVDEQRSESTYTTILGPCDRKSCCGCHRSISEMTEKSDSLS